MEKANGMSKAPQNRIPFDSRRKMPYMYGLPEAEPKAGKDDLAPANPTGQAVAAINLKNFEPAPFPTEEP